VNPQPLLVGTDSPALLTDDRLDTVMLLLEGLGNLDSSQASVRDSMLAFAAQHPDALHRSCQEGHFTGSAMVVEQGTGRVLLLFHTKLRKWLQPGGHTDGEAVMASTALREATEETGISGLRVFSDPIDLDIHEVRPPSEPAHLHHDIRFLVLAPQGSLPVGNHESESLRWFTPDEAAELDVDESVLRLIRSGLAVARGLPDAELG
jgi:8-oxo-dGTP pyrophosphatase MutT (NUDIX family)